MAEFWEAVHIRGQQTDAVWLTFGPAFQVGTTTQAMHAADVALILTHVTERDVQKDVWDDAVKAVDLNFKFIHDIGVRAPAVLDEMLEDDDPLNDDLDDIFSVDPDTQHGCMNRARRVISFWTRVNAKRAAMTPPLPPVLVGATTVAALQTALTNHPGLMQTAKNELSDAWTASISGGTEYGRTTLPRGRPSAMPCRRSIRKKGPTRRRRWRLVRSRRAACWSSSPFSRAVGGMRRV